MVLVADYIGVDSGGKVNALGAGFAFAGMQPTGLTSPQYVIVLVDVPARFAGQQFALTLELRNETTGQPVMISTAPGGQLEPLRIQQVATVQAPQIPGAYLPLDSVLSRIQMPVGFADGLPLQQGHLYAWRVQIDTQARPGWKAQFYVPGPPPPPVIGGLVGPTSIPNIAPPQPPDDGDESPGGTGPGP